MLRFNSPLLNDSIAIMTPYAMTFIKPSRPEYANVFVSCIKCMSMINIKCKYDNELVRKLTTSEEYSNFFIVTTCIECIEHKRLATRAIMCKLMADAQLNFVNCGISYKYFEASLPYRCASELSKPIECLIESGGNVVYMQAGAILKLCVKPCMVCSVEQDDDLEKAKLLPYLEPSFFCS